MSYHSQFKQDEFVYEQVLDRQKKGFFVDIGASHPIDQNNTYFFEKLGWEGIVVEARKCQYELLKEKRSCICENVAISSKREVRKFLEINGPLDGLSGLLEGYSASHLIRIVRELLTYGGSMDILDVECIPLSDLFEKHKVELIDYLSIDVEGMELAILKTIDFDAVKIRCLTVENNYKDSELSNFIMSKGYRKVGDLNCDEVYCLD